MKNVRYIDETIQAVNNTEKPYHLQCIHKMFEEQVRATPHHTALVFGDMKITYKQLNQQANQLARYLIATRAQPGDLIGIYARRSVELIISIMAVLKAGCVYVPLSTEYPGERIKYIISDCALRHIITQANLIDRLNIHHQEQKILCCDETAGFAKLDKDNLEHIDMDIADPAYVIYTSGSTGKPKGVIIPHAGICNRFCWMNDRYRFTTEDALFFKAPIGFDLSVYEILYPLLNGSRTIIAKPDGEKNIKYLTRVINEEKVTLNVFIPPLMMDLFLESTRNTDGASLRIIICCGEKWSFGLGEKCMEKLSVSLFNGYGPTEASVGVTSWQYDIDYDKKIVPLGRPISNVKVYVADDDLNQVPVNEVGELCISGVCLAQGYLNNPETTALKFKDNPFNDKENVHYSRIYMSGDLARCLDDGNIEFIGRKDNQVKIGGARIELGEIESILMQHEDIVEAVVLCKVLEDDNKLLAAFIVPQEANSIDGETVKNYLSTRVAQVMIPNIINIFEELPLTANNKIDRNKLLSLIKN